MPVPKTGALPLGDAPALAPVGIGRWLAGRLIVAMTGLKSPPPRVLPGGAMEVASGPAKGSGCGIFEQFAGRHRAAEMETLQLGATELPHDVGLTLCLDAFGRGLNAKSARKR